MTPDPTITEPAESIGFEFGALDAAGRDAWLKAFDAGTRRAEQRPGESAAPLPIGDPLEWVGHRVPNVPCAPEPDHFPDATKMIAPVVKEFLTTDPIITEPTGGKHSAVPYSFSCMDPAWLLDVAGVLHTGKLKYGAANWKLIGVETHLNHAVGHVQLFRRDGDRAELLNAACRLMFAFVVARDGVKGAKP